MLVQFFTCSSSSIAPLSSAPRNINFSSSSVTYGSLHGQTGILKDIIDEICSTSSYLQSAHPDR